MQIERIGRRAQGLFRCACDECVHLPYVVHARPLSLRFLCRLIRTQTVFVPKYAAPADSLNGI